LSWCTAEIEAGADGAVLIQGTDTIEESAYLLDLHWGRPEPIVVTGAMRSPSTPGADGPSNLLASVRVASARSSRNHGVLVVLNDEIHSAVRVRKVRSNGTNAFASPGFGPIGYFEEGAVVYGSGPLRWPKLESGQSAHAPRIVLLETYLGDDASILNLVSEAEVDGIVIAGFGVGHVSAQMADAIERANARCPVVFASRTGSGTTFTTTYSFVGSESDLLARGAIPSGWLDPRKARILLGSLIALELDREKIRAEFALRGGHPGGPPGLVPSSDVQ
jgi:L-asparaginase